MARVETINVVLKGVAQPLTSSLLGNDEMKQISVQHDTANTHVAYIGGHHLSSSVYAIRLPAPSAGEPVAPYIFDGPVRLSDIWVLGTAGETLHVSATRIA